MESKPQPQDSAPYLKADGVRSKAARKRGADRGLSRSSVPLVTQGTKQSGVVRAPCLDNPHRAADAINYGDGQSSTSPGCPAVTRIPNRARKGCFCLKDKALGST